MESLINLRKWYDDQSKVLKIILQILLGWLIGGLYRIIRYLENRNTVTLVVGIVVLVTGIGNFIAWIADLITVITSDKITFLAD